MCLLPYVNPYKNMQNCFALGTRVSRSEFLVRMKPLFPCTTLSNGKGFLVGGKVFLLGIDPSTVSAFYQVVVMVFASPHNYLLVDPSSFPHFSLSCGGSVYS